MSRRHVHVLLLLVVLGAPLTVRTPVFAGRIEATAGKRYTLTREHGPWMVMVASFHTTSEDGASDVGKSPEQAADELVFELRQKGIPAYVHSIEPSAERVITRDRTGRQVSRKNLRRVKSIAVLAGNYATIDERLAQKSLAWIKSYSPTCLQEGVVFQQTEARPTPLAGAFLTMNPLMTPEDVAAHREVDSFVLRLNHGERNSLLDNQGKYTLIVATFAGKSGVQTPLGFGGHGGQQFKEDDDLDIAANEARDLAAAMRQAEGVEAYVWHDRFQSVVTVGSFNSSSDPAMAAFKTRFGAQQQVNAAVPRFAAAKSVKVLTINGDGQRIPDIENIGSTTLPTGFRIWAYDPNPQAMAVPRKR